MRVNGESKKKDIFICNIRTRALEFAPILVAALITVDVAIAQLRELEQLQDVR